MVTNGAANSDKKEKLDFLENDFNQCFEQAQYYDSQIVNIFKYVATFYAIFVFIDMVMAHMVVVA